MTATLGLIGICLFGAWMVAIGIMCAVAPARALFYLSRMASSHRINLTEQSLRLMFGISFIARAPASHWPGPFAIAGWFVVVTSLMLMVIPLRWHAGYSIWWSKRIPEPAVRAIAPLAGAAGLAVVYAAL